MPALLACIGATKGPVLELGVGHFSTPALHALCGAMDRQLVSVEKDADWFNVFASGFSPRYPWKHEIARQWPDDQKLKWTHINNWSVVFIDDSPGGQNRREWFELMLPKSEYVVVHDYEKDNEEAIGPLLEKVPFKHITRTYEPPTLVASMTNPIPESILCL